MTAAKNNFDDHIEQCHDAIKIYEHLEKNGYSADFGLRYVWVASISALDHYVSELITEKSTEQFSDGERLTAKMLNEGVPLDAVLRMKEASPAQTVVEFRNAVKNMVQYRTFQKADDVADGLAFFWDQKHKWKKVSAIMGIPTDVARRTLNSVAYRRDLIVHNADYNDATGALYDCDVADARKATSHITASADAIDQLVP